MNKLFSVFLLVISVQFVSEAQEKDSSVLRIAFGSCANENEPQPILDLVVKHDPDLFVYLGDNIYGDTKDMNELRRKYDKLAAKPEFKKLRQNIPILATWDDHDYGWNDIGRHYQFKEESKKIFLNFFQEPANSDRWKHPGIYTSYIFEGKHNKKVQVILLDNRSFRDDLRVYNGELAKDERFFYKPDYYPHESGDSTFLGEEQWKWLEKELLKPADVRIIGSGSQFSISYNGYEAWANFPHERQRMLNLIKKTRASGVLFISGDVHYGEVSVLNEKNLYPIYDITSSGITSTWHFATSNTNRIEGPVMDNHFGLISISSAGDDLSIKFEIWDIRNNQRVEHTIRLSEISFPGN